MWHEQHLQGAMGPGSIGYQQQLSGLTSFFSRGFGGPNGAGMALATIYNQLNQQAGVQGYQDVYMELSYMSIFLVLLAFMLSKNKPGAAPGGGGGMH
jgi:DHA2 family multidrug resistance protein